MTLDLDLNEDQQESTSVCTLIIEKRPKNMSKERRANKPKERPSNRRRNV